MPGVFSPTRDAADGAWLVDGGLVNPVPVSLARALGAHIVIAVDMNSELLGGRSTEAGDRAESAISTAGVIGSQAPQWLKEVLAPIFSRMPQSIPALPSYFEVLVNALHIMQDRITRTRLAGDPPDILLLPRLGAFSWLDFHRAKDAIAAGVACVERAEAAIRYACPTAPAG
jgi:NTE family protein